MILPFDSHSSLIGASLGTHSHLLLRATKDSLPTLPDRMQARFAGSLSWWDALAAFSLMIQPFMILPERFVG